jgi:hypothetical protein
MNGDMADDLVDRMTNSIDEESESMRKMNASEIIKELKSLINPSRSGGVSRFELDNAMDLLSQLATAQQAAQTDIEKAFEAGFTECLEAFDRPDISADVFEHSLKWRMEKYIADLK